jgi:hypothetical protein
LESESQKEKILREEQNPNMAKPFNPIPLPYETLSKEAKPTDPSEVIPMPWKEPDSVKKETRKSKKKSKKQVEESEEEDPVSEYSKLDSKTLLLKKESSEVIQNWHIHLKILLFEKLCLVLFCLAEKHFSNENFGSSLKNLLLSVRCQELVTKYVHLVTSQNGCLLGRAGDCYFSLCKNFANIKVYQKEFNDLNDLDLKVLDEIAKDISDGDFKVQEICMPSNRLEELFESSISCYEAALRTCGCDSKDEIKRRLGNVCIIFTYGYPFGKQENIFGIWSGNSFRISPENFQKL